MIASKHRFKGILRVEKLQKSLSKTLFFVSFIEKLTFDKSWESSFLFYDEVI